MNPHPTLILIFLSLNVFAGLAQLWISAFYWYYHKGYLINIDVLIRDGSLLLFGTGLVASATYSVIAKPSALKRCRTFFLLILIVMVIGITASGLIYGMELMATQNAVKPVMSRSLFSTVQIYWTVFAILYTLWVAYLTDSFKEEPSSSVFY